MRRLLICAIALTASAAPLITNHADAAGLSLRKPGKIDPTTMVVNGGLIYPIGLTCDPDDAECIRDRGFGHIRISFPTPIDNGNHVDFFAATCTPKYEFAPTATDVPTAPITRTFGPMTDNYADTPALRAQGYRKGILANTSGVMISLLMPRYEDPATSAAGAQYPPLSCAVTSINDPLLHPGVYPGGGGYTVASKPPKLTTSLRSDCAAFDGGGGFADSPTIIEPTFEAGKATLHLSAVLNVRNVIFFQWCSTDPSYRAYFNTSQAAIVSAQTTAKRGRATIANGVEIAPAPRTAAVKKLNLTIPFVTPIPLDMSGSQITYRFDASKLQVAGGNAGCVMKAAKNPQTRAVPGFGTIVDNTCVVDQATGTITLLGSENVVVEGGKPITTAETAIDFTYVNDELHPETTSAITLEKARFQITIATTIVTLEFEPAGIAYAVADPNIGAPAVTLTGLI